MTLVLNRGMTTGNGKYKSKSRILIVLNQVDVTRYKARHCEEIPFGKTNITPRDSFPQELRLCTCPPLTSHACFLLSHSFLCKHREKCKLFKICLRESRIPTEFGETTEGHVLESDRRKRRKKKWIWISSNHELFKQLYTLNRLICLLVKNEQK